MKQRTKDYMERRKAQCAMRHPGDLKSFLVAEHDASRNLIVKKDIRKMIEQLEEKTADHTSNEIL
ncbi:MAG: hypothetical protein EOO01_11390 [Chitinophagaceae bacterium]|nr:MAG: hypothetical protein EOO01_11390 [Chitinophagaceae bacterium]